MSIAVTRTKTKPERPSLSPEKGSELVGLVLLSLALLLALALATYHPGDPSVFHSPAGKPRPQNLAGPFGAEIAAFGFEFLGVSCLLVPFFLTVMGWRRLRRRNASRVVGRGFGALLLLAALPGLLHLSAGRISWREGSVLSGGAFGKILSEVLETRLSFGGTSVVLVALVVIGSALVIQSTLGDLMTAWKARIAAWLEESRLARERRRERREKEKARRRVITKHLQRVVEEKKEKQQREAQVVTLKGEPVAAGAGSRAARAAEATLQTPETEPESPYGDRLDLPLRVTERRGEGEFAVRRVRGTQPAPPPMSPISAGSAGDDGDDDFWEQREAALAGPAGADEMPAPRAAAPRAPRPAPQKDLPFTGDVRPGELPPVNLLQLADHRTAVDGNELVRLGETIRSRCAEFGVDGSVEGISPGPVITVYEFQPAPGVKVSQIVNLQDDLALALKAESVRIDRMPGRSTLGIEVPNRERGIIRLGNLMADERFRKAPSVLTMALGTNIHGEPYYADLATMPHLLVAGATGAGKSVGLQSMITSILYKATREEVQFIFIDPKRIELGVYADIPHLKAEVVVDPKKAANALRWAVAEMERRYRLLAEVHVRSIGYYNRAIQDPEVQQRLSLTDSDTPVTASDLKPMPYYVVVIDELADLMMVSSAEVETSIARLAQMARAVGIHLIIATQRPSVDVLTGTIKANFPCRISFATASRHDSRTILDQVGSEKLLGKGDMLMMPPGTSRIMRLHGAYISEQETAALVRWLKKQGKPELDPDVLRNPDGDGAGSGDGGDNDDDLYDQAARLVVAERQASASFLQRRMRVGFSRAARLIDMMERDGLLGPPQGSKPREVLVKPDYFLEVDEGRGEE
jgi:DNA segregation ATPase FtsK/SpoIIIE, S-DNA-T family